MTQEDKQLLLRDLCTRLPYGVKILHTGWDSDRNIDFDTVETLIGIDNEFIYTVWDKTGDREKHCLSISNWKPYLRHLSSMTDEEEIEFEETLQYTQFTLESYDWLNAHHFDYRELIERGLALKAPKDMYNNVK